MKVIYVAGRYRGQSESEVFNNIIHARNAAIKLWQEGWAVICPHTNSMFMGTRLGDTTFLDGDLEIVRRCDAIYMLRGWEDSVGACMEHDEAMKQGQKIYYEESL